MAERIPTSESRSERVPPEREPPPTDAPWRAAAMHAIALAAAFGLLYVVWLLLRPLALLFVAVVIATALQPLVSALERWLPRVLAIVLVYLGLAAVLGGIGWIIVPPMADQAGALVSNAPDLVQQGQDWLNRWDAVENAQIGQRLETFIGRFGSTLAGLPLTLVSAATELLLVLAMSIYWLIAAPAIRRFALSLVPHARREEASDLIAETGRTVGGYIRGAVLDGLIMGILVYPGLLILGVDYPLVLSVLVVLGELVPIVGPTAAAVPALGIALIESPMLALKVVIFYVVLQQVESNVVEPNIMSRQTDMPPLLVLFALLAGSSLAGFLGAIIAIPLAGAVRVAVLRLIAPAIRRWAGAEPVNHS